ncbi:hypothetical protein EMIHUDRAFT_121228, partial [Emiliania huxleyi CCMP1516]|uniref:ABC transporter domain-containing protein n=2 Tax=Emiliania huxleyi TaxID=2903 RepID=A0A0D3I5Y0_EMIH1
MKAIIKPQYVDHIPRAVKGKVGDIIKRKDERDALEEALAARSDLRAQGALDFLDLRNVLERNVEASPPRREIAESGASHHPSTASELTPRLGARQDLSGGELQRFAIAIVLVQQAAACLGRRAAPESWSGSSLTAVHQADVYMFDEPSSYLDVMQRLKAARAIRSLLTIQTYVIVVEHDLSVLDYLSDFICCLYGELALVSAHSRVDACKPSHTGGIPGAYGVVTMPFGVREGINIFLGGFIPTENLRFRDDALTFKVSENAEQEGGKEGRGAGECSYPAMTKTLGAFTLHVEAGSFSRSEISPSLPAGSFSGSEILVMLGENGTGKTTFIKMLAGHLAPDGEAASQAHLPASPRISPRLPAPLRVSSRLFASLRVSSRLPTERRRGQVPKLNVSYKPQKIAPSFDGTVRELLHKKIREAFIHPQFNTDVMKPMLIERLLDQE